MGGTTPGVQGRRGRVGAVVEAVVAALTLEVVVRAAVVLPPGFVPVVLCPDVAAEEDSCVEEAVSVLVGGAALLTLRPGILKGYQFKRILAVLTPDDPALADITYQQNKGAMAIGTGGLTGQGLLSGEHIFVPNAWNDFIFAYLANVLGFLGAAAVLLLLFALCLRTLRTGLQCPDALGCNICVGIFAALFLQCVINIGMNLQVLPVIGVTLPFYSAGGSSVLMLYICVGLVLSVYMHNTKKLFG